MPRVDLASHVPLAHMYNTKQRQAIAPAFTWRSLTQVACHVAALVDGLHRSGYVVGDLSERRFLVSPRTLVTLVGCDSLQVPGDGRVFRSSAGNREFTPPELQRVDLGMVDRTPEHDCFSLGILLFKLLMEGVHPLDALREGPEELRPLAKRMEACEIASQRTVPAPPLALLPEGLLALFVRCFGEGLTNPKVRPTAAEWHQGLLAVDGLLQSCSENPRHVHPESCDTCPWCERTRQLGEDPFPAPAAQQPLSPTSFVSGDSAPGLGRARARAPLRGTLWSRLPLRRVLVGACVLAAALGVSVYQWTRRPPPAQELRLQKMRLTALARQHQLVTLSQYLKDSGLPMRLAQQRGFTIQAVRGFAPVRPKWTVESSNCEVKAGTPLELKSYVDNTGFFAASHYSAVVSLPREVCPGSPRLIIAPMDALPPPLRLLDCPGRGGGLAGFAWHSTEEWSCAPLPGSGSS
jgi:hypothetical protein